MDISVGFHYIIEFSLDKCLHIDKQLAVVIALHIGGNVDQFGDEIVVDSARLQKCVHAIVKVVLHHVHVQHVWLLQGFVGNLKSKFSAKS